jgi:hypothetical protein
MNPVIGKPVGHGFPVATPIATVISYRIPSQFKEPRRIGGGEVGSEPIEYRGTRHLVNKKDRKDSYALWSLYWIKRHECDIYFEPSYERFKIMFWGICKSKNWKKKNMVGYYKRDTSGNVQFSNWDVVDSETDIVVGRKIY